MIALFAGIAILPASEAATVTGGCTQAGSVITCTSSGTYKPTAGVCSVSVLARGGGGGGGGVSAAGYSGGGGAGGALAQSTLALIDTTTYTVTVGGGGTAGSTAGGDGGTGGDSWFSSTATILAKGGAGGGGDPTTAAPAGAGATGTTGGSIGTTLFAGGNGGNGDDVNIVSGGGGGGAGTTASGGNGGTPAAGAGGTAGGGNGGVGRTGQQNGAPGAAPGGAGSGGNNIDPLGIQQSGGAGGAGTVVITETPSSCASCTGTTPTAAASTITPATQSTPTGVGVSVTVTLKEADGDCVSGKSVTLTSSRPAVDTIVTSPTTTDGSGKAVFTVSSTTPGTSTYTAVDTTDTVTLSSTADVVYVAAAVVTGGCSVSGNVITCTSTGTYKPAAGVTCVKAEAWGGGGGGGGVSTAGYSGGGGAGGSYAISYVGVSASTTYDATVASGGAGGTAAGSNGGVGGPSDFEGYVVANGGPGGDGSTGTTNEPGGTGTTTGSIGTVKYRGGNGGTGTTPSAGFGGGGGGGAGSTGIGGAGGSGAGGTGTASGGGNGGTGLSSDSNGAPGSAAGGGGAGGHWTANPGNTGGAGAGGKIMLTEYPPVTAGSSTVAASPAGVAADGATTSTVTVKLVGACGNAPGKVVRLDSSRGAAVDTITPTSAAPITATTASTDAAGEAKFTIKSSTCGVATVTATDTTDSIIVTQTADVSFAATSGANAGTSTVTASPTTQLADGVSVSTISVTLKTAAGCPVTGKTITLASSRSASDTVAPASATTDNTGVATFTAKSSDYTTNSGLSVYTATDSSDGFPIMQTASVTWTIPISGSVFVDQPQNTGRGLPFVPVVRVRVLDPNGNPFGTPMPVTLSIKGNPAGVHLVNGPNQGPGDAAGNPWTMSGAGGLASFPGLAVLVDDLAFTGAAYQISSEVGGFVTDSEPFRVGRTSPPWMQFNFNSQRTGWSPNIADFSDPAQRTKIANVAANDVDTQALGDVTTTPILVDLDGDGVLDLVTVNRVNKGTIGSAFPTIQAWDLSSCATTCAPALLWKQGLSENLLAGAGGNTVTNLAAVYGPGATAPTIIGNDITNTNQDHVTPWFTGTLYTINNGVVSQTINSGTAPNSGYPFSSPPLIANVAPGGLPALVLEETDATFLKGGVRILPVSGAGTISAGTAGTFTSGNPFGGNIASAELRSQNSLPDIAVVVAQQGFVGGGAAGGWNSATLAVCRPEAATVNCSETVAVSDAALNSVAIGDLNVDGWHELVFNGLRSAAYGAVIGTPNQLQVFDGAGTLASTPMRRSGEGDLYNTPTLGNLDAANNNGPFDIVNINYGAPPTSDDTGGDSYTDTGNVMRRGLNAAGTGLQAEGTWTRAGTVAAPSESPGGGILLDVTADGRAEFIAGSRDGTVIAAGVTGGTPTMQWTMNNLGSLTATDPSQGIPLSPIAAGDVTGDCHAELFAGLSGGSSGSGEVAVLRGKAAVAPGAASFVVATDYDITPADVAWLLASDGTSPGDAPVPDRIAKLAWNAPAANGGLPIVAYNVYRATGLANGGGPTTAFVKIGMWPSGITPTPQNPFIDDTLTVDGDYYYQVAPITCFTMANALTATSGSPFQDGSGPISGVFYSEVKRPQAPTALSSTAGTSSITLTWTAPATTPGAVDKPHGCGLTASFTYNLYRRGSPSTGVAPIPGPPYQTGLSGLTYTDTGLPAGSSYDYQISAVNCVGESPLSNLISAAVGTPPSAPTGLIAQPFGMPAYAVADPAPAPCQPPATGVCKYVRLDWSAASVAGSSCASLTGYKAYRSPAGLATYTLLGTVAAPATTYADITAPLGASYDYAVASYCTSPAPFESAKATTTASVPVTLPSTSPAPTVTGQIEMIRVQWNDPGANNAACNWEEGYIVTRGVSTGGPYTYSIYATIEGSTEFAGSPPAGWRPSPTPASPLAAPGVTALSYDDSGIAPGEVYTYALQAVNCVGTAAAGTASIALPAMPADVVAKPYGDPAYSTAATKAVEVSWTPVTLAGDCGAVADYIVYRRISGGLPGQYLYTSIASTASSTLTDTNPVVGTSYDYAVSARCPAYEGPISVPAVADVLLPNTPAAPVALLASATTAQISWTDPGANNNSCNWQEGYRIYRQDNGVGGFNPIGLVTGTPETWTIVPPGARTIATWGAPTTAPALTFDDTTIAVGSTYEYTVSAVNCVGESAQSPIGTLTTPVLPEAPTGLTAKPYGKPAYATAPAKRVQLDWTALTTAQWGGCTGGLVYNIQRGPPGGPYVDQASVAEPATTWTDTGAIAGFPIVVGDTYGYVIQAACTTPFDMESTTSTEATAEVTIPAAPVMAAPTIGIGPAVTLTWTAPAANNGNCDWIEGYRIYRGTAGPGSESLTPHATVMPSGVTTWPRTLYGTAPAVPAATFIDTPLPYASTYHYTVTAVNCVGESVWSTEVSATIPPNQAPTASFDAPLGGMPENGLQFTDTSTDPDGRIACYLWDFGDGTTSTAQSPNHVYKATGKYTVKLTVCDDAGATSSATQGVTVEWNFGNPGLGNDSGGPTPEQPIVDPSSCDPLLADAGDDGTAVEGTVVQLAGSACQMTHAGFGFSWTQVKGPAVDLHGADRPNATFTAPDVGPAGAVVGLALQVSQGGAVSPLAYVNVTIADGPDPSGPDLNQAPLAYAGEDLVVAERGTVTLDAAGSMDPDNEGLSYTWTQIAGPPVVLSDAASPRPTFTAPQYGSENELEFMVEVSDGALASNDLLRVSVTPQAASEASATPAAVQAPAPMSLWALWVGLGLLAARGAGWAAMAWRRRGAP